MIPFTEYAKIKDNYCVAYFGHEERDLLRLQDIRLELQQKFPDLNIYLGYRDEMAHLLTNYDKTLMLSEIKNCGILAHLKELRYNGVTNPIDDFVSDI